MTDSAKTSTTWKITVNDQSITVTAPARVYIGRKPMRPVEVPDNATRFDVPDLTKSMSKNHALLTVEDNGQAELSDLNSTNGTYIRNAHDALLRVPAENPYTISSEQISGQFGDVSFEIAVNQTRQQSAPEGPAPAVQNLFDFKSPVSDDAPAPSMSVDDILDLRAGEPTHMFAMQPAAVQDEEAEEPHVDSAATPQVVVNEDSGYVPVYEAGSVFDRLSRGDFEHTDTIVEVRGHTSVEAKSTQDFNVQFDIAQIPELLPFLGLNPFLYDDMYAWLEAQNNDSVNKALESNEGYQTWKASSK
ncbi:FHA domain-containing protein [Alloscardovia omnicolens]|uniref:FHA domain-containing protein n=1 Tax=Alloscardovia omnicolens TaxID=419015 RepID=UPI0003B4846C|nr:FHA domain-containing protein [Alloscardovia omnicolens]